MEYKLSKSISVKEIGEVGTFEGILSPYGNIDGGRDVVEPGAYTKTLKESGMTRPLLWTHKSDCPIGSIELEDRPDGLWCKGALLMDLQAGKDAYVRIKGGVVKGLSIGFESIKDSVKNGIRHLEEIKLWEGSLVCFPMNARALLTDVKAKGEGKDGFTQELTDIQTLDTDYQIMQALSLARRSVIWADMSREEKIATRATINAEYVAFDAAFFPMYLDVLDQMYGGMETWSAKHREIKSGAAISSANKTLIKNSLAQILNAHESLSALVAEEAGTSTSDGKAAVVDPKPEPVPDHSAEVELVSALRALIPTA